MKSDIRNRNTVQTYRIEVLDYSSPGFNENTNWKLLGIRNSESQALEMLSNPGFVRVFKCGARPSIIASNFSQEEFREAMSGF